MTDMVKMVGKRGGVDQDIVKINDDKLADEVPKDVIHEAHEGVRRIGETKGHHEPFIQPLLGFERRLPFITFPHTDLMVTTLEIHFRENGGTMELIKHMIEPWDRVAILDRDLVDGPAINTHTPRPVLFGDKDDRDGTRAQGLSDIALV